MIPAIVGADAVASWFGRWPSLHGAEVLSIHVNRGGRSHIRLYTFITTDRKDSTGRFLRGREAWQSMDFMVDTLGRQPRVSNAERRGRRRRDWTVLVA